jgi:hypothetical protein
MDLQVLADLRELLKPGEVNQVSLKPQIDFDVATWFTWIPKHEVAKMWMPYSLPLILELNSWRSEMPKNGSLVAQNSATEFCAP